MELERMRRIFVNPRPFGTCVCVSVYLIYACVSACVYVRVPVLFRGTRILYCLPRSPDNFMLSIPVINGTKQRP